MGICRSFPAFVDGIRRGLEGFCEQRPCGRRGISIRQLLRGVILNPSPHVPFGILHRIATPDRQPLIMRLRKPLELEPIPLLYDLDNNLVQGPWKLENVLNGQIGLLIHCVHFEGCGTISQPLEDFLRLKAKCPRCLTPAGDLLDRGACGCEGTANRSSYDLLLIGEADYDLYYQLARASDKGARNKRRNEALGVIPKAFYQVLGSVQNFACYYCTRPLTTEPVNSDAKAHMEHQDPYQGSTLDNLVLSCRLCNTQKGLRSAEQFARTKKRELTVDQVRDRVSIWRSVRTWRSSPEGETWASKLPSQ